MESIPDRGFEPATETSRHRPKAQPAKPTVEEIMAIAHRCAALPVLDDRSPNEIIGYDENGIPC
jgi:antitoxin VapB